MKMLPVVASLAYIALLSGCQPKVEEPNSVELKSSVSTYGVGSPIVTTPGASVIVNMNGDKVEVITNNDTTTVITTGQDGTLKNKSTVPTPQDPVELRSRIDSNNGTVVAETYGKDSPVVVTNGGSISINYGSK